VTAWIAWPPSPVFALLSAVAIAAASPDDETPNESRTPSTTTMTVA
jgi:hypothetical protein